MDSIPERPTSHLIILTSPSFICLHTDMPWLDCGIIHVFWFLWERERREREGGRWSNTANVRTKFVLFCLSGFFLPLVNSFVIRYLLPCTILKSKQQRKQKRTNKWPVRHNSVNNVLDALKRHDVKAIRSFGTNQNYHCSKSVRMRPTIDKTNQKRGEKA